jgi:D-methionine transport system substrate-binding protein
LLLQKAGLIAVDPEKKDSPSTLDIVSNPKKLKFEELEAPMLTRSLPDVTIAVIPTNFALEAGLIPKEDGLTLESTDSPMSTSSLLGVRALKIQIFWH